MTNREWMFEKAKLTDMANKGRVISLEEYAVGLKLGRRQKQEYDRLVEWAKINYKDINGTDFEDDDKYING